MTDELDIPDGWYLRDGDPRVTWFWIAESLIACDRPIRILGPVCSSSGCATLAEFRTWWPGRADIALLHDDADRRFALMELD